MTALVRRLPRLSTNVEIRTLLRWQSESLLIFANQKEMSCHCCSYASLSAYPMPNTLSLVWLIIDRKVIKWGQSRSKQRTSRPHQYWECWLQCHQSVSHIPSLHKVEYTLSLYLEINSLTSTRCDQLHCNQHFFTLPQQMFSLASILRMEKCLVVHRETHGSKFSSGKTITKIVYILQHRKWRVISHFATNVTQCQTGCRHGEKWTCSTKEMKKKRKRKESEKKKMK